MGPYRNTFSDHEIPCQHFHYAGPAEMFFGPNALGRALAALWMQEYEDDGKVHQEDAYNCPLEAACSWSKGDKAFEIFGPEIVGKALGVHAKVYICFSTQAVVLSSQNNGSSPFVEHATVFFGEAVTHWWYDQLVSLKDTVENRTSQDWNIIREANQWRTPSWQRFKNSCAQQLQEKGTLTEKQRSRLREGPRPRTSGSSPPRR